MTKIIETLDALPGCGKTTAIFDYMAKHQDQRWLYLSPMKKEINERVPAESDRVGMSFFIASERDNTEKYDTKSQQVLEALRSGDSVACTHNLMMRFSEEHLELLRAKKYNIVCDEELELINGYNGLTKADIVHLTESNCIRISEVDGKIEFIKEFDGNMRYSDVKRYADFGCLYASKTRKDFLVIQISPKLIDCAQRFILLTYNYKGSIMDTFMRMHGYESKEIDCIKTYKSTSDVVKQVKNLVEILDTPSIRSWHKRKNTLSATWWRETATKEDLDKLSKDCGNVIFKEKKKSSDCMITFPKGNSIFNSERKNKVFKPKRIDVSESFVQSTARATNEFAHKTLAIHLLNIYPIQPVKIYMQDMGFECDDDAYALNTMIQWVFRSAIRNGEPIKIALFSKRMQDLLLSWMEGES